MSNTTKPKINLALAAIITDIEKVSKDRKNDQQGFKFRGIDDIYNALHPIFAAHGVTCIPQVDQIIPSVIRYDVVKNGTTEEKRAYHSIVVLGFKLTADDGSFELGKSVGEGLDFADKATAKALSAAHKYFLIQTFLIPTADIADADYESTSFPHDELKAQKEEAARAAEAQRQQEALDKKRDDAQAALEQNGTPQGATTVQEAPAPAKATRKPRAEKDQAKPADAPADPVPTASKEEVKPTPETTKPAVSQPAANSWEEFVIKPPGLTHPKFIDRKVGNLSLEELELLEKNWCGKPEFEEGIQASPEKTELRNNLRLALIARRAGK